MEVIFRRILLVVKAFLSLCLTLGLVGLALAQDPQTAPLVEPKTGIAFPQALGPLKRMGLKHYGSPDLGVSCRYAARPLPIADIYLYDNGVKDLGTGLNQMVRLHFEQVQDEIFFMEKSGYYRSVKKVSEGETGLANGARKLPALVAVFTYRQPPGKGVAYTGVRTSYVYLTTYKGQFLKIRFTYPKNQENRGHKALQQFLADLGKILGNRKNANHQNIRSRGKKRNHNHKARTAGR
jgi:hypothetical protein